MIPRLAILENIATLCVFAAVVIFAPSCWKWMALFTLLFTLLNLNYRETK